jgi:hypothetical protein
MIANACWREFRCPSGFAHPPLPSRRAGISPSLFIHPGEARIMGLAAKFEYARDVSAHPPQETLGRPYCNECGYTLTGLTDSSKCPECGQPLVAVLMRDELQGRRAYRYTSPAKLFGLPLLAIALGPAQGERVGRPKGIIAIGEFPRGVVAIGIVPIGVVSLGSFAIGLLSFGGAALGGLLACGGIACGLVALGGLAIGGVTFGGLCLYLISGRGGQAVPLWP